MVEQEAPQVATEETPETETKNEEGTEDAK